MGSFQILRESQMTMAPYIDTPVPPSPNSRRPPELGPTTKFSTTLQTTINVIGFSVLATIAFTRIPTKDELHSIRIAMEKRDADRVHDIQQLRETDAKLVEAISNMNNSITRVEAYAEVFTSRMLQPTHQSPRLRQVNQNIINNKDPLEGVTP
jgi:hypothetical protein